MYLGAELLAAPHNLLHAHEVHDALELRLIPDRQLLCGGEAQKLRLLAFTKMTNTDTLCQYFYRSDSYPMDSCALGKKRKIQTQAT